MTKPPRFGPMVQPHWPDTSANDRAAPGTKRRDPRSTGGGFMSSHTMPADTKPMTAPRAGWRRHLWYGGLVLALAAMWGSSFLMVDTALRDFTPSAALAGRMAIAA